MKPEEYREGGNNGAVLQVPEPRHVDATSRSRRAWRGTRAVGLALRLRRGTRQAPRRRRSCCSNEQHAAEQHLVLPARAAGQVHRPGAERDAEQRRDRVDRDRARGHLSGAGRRRLRRGRRRDRGIGGLAMRCRRSANVTSTVRAVDGDALLTPAGRCRQIVRAVAAVRSTTTRRTSSAPRPSAASPAASARNETENAE